MIFVTKILRDRQIREIFKISLIFSFTLISLCFSACSVENRQKFLSSNYLIDIKGNKSNILQYIENQKVRQPFALVFIAAECPISQKYIPILRGMQKQFPQVKFLAIFTKWDNAEAINNFLKEYPLSISNDVASITVLQDEKNKLVKKIDAHITPEVFLFDKKSVLIYRGAIDNWFFALGKYRQEPTERYLSDAIQAMLKNEPIKIKKTDAIGCIIER